MVPCCPGLFGLLLFKRQGTKTALPHQLLLLDVHEGHLKAGGAVLAGVLKHQGQLAGIILRTHHNYVLISLQSRLAA
jgi:hypothetical protein